MRTNRGIAHLFLLVLVTFVAIGAVGYLAYKNSQLKQDTAQGEFSSPPTPSPAVTKTLTGCETCPQFIPPSPDWCKDGKVIQGEVNKCGCQGPPKCEYSNWKTHTNAKYGFTFKYPPDFFITQVDSIKPSEALSTFVIAPEKHKDSLGSQIPMLTLTVHNNSGSSLLDWFSVHATKKKFDDPSASMKDSPFYYREYTNPQPITFDGKEGISFSSWTMNGEVNHVLLITPDQNYILDWGSNENFRLGYKKTFDQILSTFQFTE